MKKVDTTKLLGVAAMILGVVGTLVSNVASQKQMDAKIAEDVAKKLETKSKQRSSCIKGSFVFINRKE